MILPHTVSFKLDSVQLIPIARIIKIDNVHVVIECPYCGQKHYHGSRGGQEWWGHRAPHCDVKFTPYNQQGYIIPYQNINNGVDTHGNKHHGQIAGQRSTC